MTCHSVLYSIKINPSEKRRACSFSSSASSATIALQTQHCLQIVGPTPMMDNIGDMGIFQGHVMLYIIIRYLINGQLIPVLIPGFFIDMADLYPKANSIYIFFVMFDALLFQIWPNGECSSTKFVIKHRFNLLIMTRG